MYPRFSNSAAGFTLIELVLVMVILAILVASIMPRFADLGTQARISAIKALAGSIQTTINNLRLECAVNPSCSLSNDQLHVYLNGQWYWLNYGWVDAGDDIGGDEIDTALTISGFSVTLPNNRATLFSLADAPAPANCSVLYYQATIATPKPVITLTTSGC